MRLGKKIFFWLGLAVYTVILFFFMTFYRLPADKLIAATLENLTEGRLFFRVQKVSPLLPPRYRLEGISYGILLGDTQITDGFSSLTLGPDYMGLFKGYLPIEIKGSMTRGSFHGKTGVSIISGVEDSYLMIKTDDLFLEDLNILGPLLNRDIKGKLKSEIKVKGDLTDPTKITGRGYFHLEKGSIDTRIDLPGLERVPFDSISLDFTFKDGKLTLNKGEMGGPMFSGNFSGEIQWEKKLANSRLKITAKLNPGPLLMNNQLARQFFRKGKRENVSLTIKIGGTLKRPSIKWSKS